MAYLLFSMIFRRRLPYCGVKGKNLSLPEHHRDPVREEAREQMSATLSCV